MVDKEPTLPEWRELYETANEFCRMAPWTWMSDADLFGVQNPESGEIGYCCIMGNAREVFGMHVYKGVEGLAGYWAIAQASKATLDDAAVVQKFIGLNMEDRSHLRPKDLATIKSLGLKYRGAGAWPMFFNMEPGYVGWYLTAQETRFMTIALRQAMNVAIRFRENPALLPNFTGPDDERYLVRKPSKSSTSDEWMDIIQTPEIFEGRLARVILDRERIVQLGRTLPRAKNIFEIDYIAMLESVISESPHERPWIPNMVIAVDAQSEFVLEVKLVQEHETLQELTNVLLRTFETTGMLPSAIHVRRPDLLGIVAPICQVLEIRYQLEKRLPALAKAHKSFARFSRSRA